MTSAVWCRDRYPGTASMSSLCRERRTQAWSCCRTLVDTGLSLASRLQKQNQKVGLFSATSQKPINTEPNERRKPPVIHLHRYYPESLTPSTSHHTSVQQPDPLPAQNLPMEHLAHFPLSQVSGWARKCSHLSSRKDALPLLSYPSPTWGCLVARGISQL